MSKGGRTSGTWTGGSTWRSGQTKTIRVPVVLEAQIMDYARAIDGAIDVSHVNTADSILSAIDRYIAWRHQNYRSTQAAKEPDTTSRTWDELRKFQRLLRENPAVLLDDDTCR
ncbi:hypothetical protein I8752_34365 [Nostocaceae cyanobacterium CENA369]|uniref:Uncharacterized protein n=1 Tax=Dendronalium phyllosphericum CENA369 TaxID=1725256 RepID=A0A8J7LPL9_9NOST|nr:hypothetical protein [Dendronalium phyllosphericum]MBH8577959.1 hypothetical protein [Dendronalium phyllosphericum CENA369]